MDNQNNQGSSNPNPLGGAPTPSSDLNTPFPPNPSSPPSSPPTWLPPSTPSPAPQNPTLNTEPSSPVPQASNQWGSTPQVPQPVNDPNPISSPSTDPAAPLSSANSSTWPNLPSAPADSSAPPTFTPPTDISSTSNGSPSAGSSPLDNPWGAPIQSPAIDGSQQPPQPTWVPPQTVSNTTISPTPETPLSAEPNSAPAGPAIGGAGGQSEPAPTDLSHLISNNPVESGQNPTNTSETLVVPPTSNAVPEVPTLPIENHKTIPKWLLGVGVLLLIVVIGASAYFILGIGQGPQTTSSVPAQVSKTTVKAPPPIATPVPQAGAPAATGSANFGELQDSQTQQATSAADLLKQRQQGR